MIYWLGDSLVVYLTEMSKKFPNMKFSFYCVTESTNKNKDILPVFLIAI